MNWYWFQEYAKNPSKNWKNKDAAIYLVTSLAAKGKTQKVSADDELCCNMFIYVYIMLHCLRFVLPYATCYGKNFNCMFSWMAKYLYWFEKSMPAMHLFVFSSESHRRVPW